MAALLCADSRTGSVTTALIYTSPIFVMLLSAAIFKEKITRVKVMAVLLAVAGCALTAECFGNEVTRLYDVGVEGLHRLLSHMDEIMSASVIIAVAGMEGALASVVGGLVDCPVVAEEGDMLTAAHSHDQVHPHDHDHTHDHAHAHDDGHTHGHTHGHNHAHGHAHSHSRMADIEHIVRGHLDLPEAVKDDVMKVYGLIAEAESRAHGMPVEEIHFHEVGTMDAVPVVMKKGRPGTLISVLCRQQEKEDIIGLIFKHTSTIGIRQTPVQRYVLDRKSKELDTPYGPVRRKTSSGYGVEKVKYEHDDLARIADERGISIEEARRLLP